MNLQYLKSFYITVKLNSISKAAKELHLTQPGLSMQLQSLEKEFDSKLLTRSNRGVELTDAGKILFDYADTILSLQDNIQRDLSNFKTSKKELFLGACKSIGEHALPCSIYIFKNQHPDININFNIYNSQDVINRLKDNTINLGIVQGHISEETIDSEFIGEDPILLVTSSPTQKKEISLDELRDIPLISREKGSGNEKSVEEALKQHGIRSEDLNIMYRLNSMEAIKSSVASGKGMAFIPKLTIERELYEGTLHPVNVENLNVSSSYYIIYRKKHPFSIYEEEFKKFLQSSSRGFC
ncbi:LysR family transcriptional regulator [Isachenkonia alkalipeptolytica]|uniref:LysR family transcriptional regulator n=2 Tax=Isachenkonia alkalipeptolytica TaxID=2565777 RepID=A0AA43XIY4_9CLOT|nr:LysR family transcriptional regulator [Isachenkonia alkalipeptolytica]NBG87331.1 LysR family transcriptional regulator [Isachenkonia alkalipeptolytica]